MTLRQKTFSAVRWTTLAAIFRAMLQIAQMTVLVRLLAPSDYGLMAMVSLTLGFAGTFSDLGINNSFLQRQDVNQAERSSLFWMNVAMSAALSLSIIALSPSLAWLFGDERLTPLMMLSASTLLIAAFGTQVRMAAEKELDFRPVIQLEVLAAILGFLAALFSALSGWGVYSLVAGSIVGAIADTTFAWFFIARGWRPNWRLRMEDVRPHLKFGGAMVVNNIVNQINISIDLFLCGRLLGASTLGIYSIPRNLVLQIQFMVNPIITRVSFPLIAKVQHDVATVRSIYLKTLNMTAAINAPLYVGIAFFAPEVVAIILGERWQEAAPLLRILAVWGLFRSVINPVGSLLMGMGRAGLSMKWNIGMLIIFPPVVWLGSSFGAKGIALALLCLVVFSFIPGWYILVNKLCRANLIEYSIATLRPFVLAFLSIAPAYLLVRMFDDDMMKLATGVVISVPVYLAISYKANNEWYSAMLQLARRC